MKNIILLHCLLFSSIAFSMQKAVNKTQGNQEQIGTLNDRLKALQIENDRMHENNILLQKLMTNLTLLQQQSRAETDISSESFNTVLTMVHAIDEPARTRFLGIIENIQQKAKK